MHFSSRSKNSSRGIQLDDYESDPQKSKASNSNTWIGNDLNLQPKSQISHNMHISAAKHDSDAERDDRLLPGILVTRDVDVDRASAPISESSLKWAPILSPDFGWPKVHAIGVRGPNLVSANLAD